MDKASMGLKKSEARWEKVKFFESASSADNRERNVVGKKGPECVWQKQEAGR